MIAMSSQQRTHYHGIYVRGNTKERWSESAPQWKEIYELQVRTKPSLNAIMTVGDDREDPCPESNERFGNKNRNISKQPAIRTEGSIRWIDCVISRGVLVNVLTEEMCFSPVIRQSIIGTD